MNMYEILLSYKRVCMQDTFARARTRPRPSARDDRVSCIQQKGVIEGTHYVFLYFLYNHFLQYALTLHQTFPRNYLVQINRDLHIYF